MLIELRSYVVSAVNVGGRMYPDTLPQNPTLPAITYQMVSESRRPTLHARDTLPRTRVQMDCWAASGMEAHAVADDVLSVLDCFQGMMGSPGVYVNGSFSENGFDGFDDVAKMYRVSRDYLVWARE